jgi:nickel/cobalt exporter
MKTLSQKAWRCLAVALPALPLALLLVAILPPGLSFGQGFHHPFAVGVNEGAVSSTQGIAGWILAQEAGFYRLLSGAIRGAKESGTAAWGLVAMSLAYGVFHAAGPGHGKAVIASYMLANERALKRGLAIAFAAAALQGFSAVAVVGISAIIVKATAQHMTAAVNLVEIVSYAGISALGIMLVYVKSTALLSVLRPAGGKPAPAFAAHDCCGAGHDHGSGCGHMHAPDPATLGNGFSWHGSLLTITAAGLRPCSGAILVLVFALSQGIFKAGVYAAVAMSLGTAITTAALASAAVLVKNMSIRFAKADSRRALIAGRVLETLAALAVLGLGLALLLGAAAGGSRVS